MASYEEAENMRGKVLHFTLDQCENGGQGYGRVLLQLFGFTGHGKSSLINSCFYTLLETTYKKYAATPDSNGAVTVHRTMFYLTPIIAIVDNRGCRMLSPSEAGEVYAQLGNFLPLNEKVEWSETFKDMMSKLEEAEGKQHLTDFIVPVFVYSAATGLPKEQEEEIRNFIKTCKHMAGVAPIVVLTHAEGRNYHKMEKIFESMGAAYIFKVENYTDEDHFRSLHKDHEILSFLYYAIEEVKYRMHEPRDQGQERSKRKHFLEMYFHDQDMARRGKERKNKRDRYGRCDEEESYNADIQLDTETLTFVYESPDSENPHPHCDPNIYEIPRSDPMVSSSAFEPEEQLYDEKEENLYGNSSQNTQPGDMKPFTYLSPRMEAELSEKDGLKKWVNIKKAKAWQFNADDGTWSSEQSLEKEQDREVTMSKNYNESDQYSTETFPLDYESPDSGNPQPCYGLNISEIPRSDPVVSSSALEPEIQLCDVEEEDLYENNSQNTQPGDMKPFTYLRPVTESGCSKEAKLSETNGPKKWVNLKKTKAWKFNERDGKWYREQSPEGVRDKKAAKSWRFDASNGKWHRVDK